MKQITITIPEIKDVEFTIECLPEYAPIKGNAMASDDAEYDKKVENSIQRSLNAGNKWAWCCVKVTASYKGFSGTDYLGCCNYKSEKDFIKNSGYYEDMKQTAYDELIKELETLAD